MENLRPPAKNKKSRDGKKGVYPEDALETIVSRERHWIAGGGTTASQKSFHIFFTPSVKLICWDFLPNENAIAYIIPCANDLSLHLFY